MKVTLPADCGGWPQAARDFLERGGGNVEVVDSAADVIVTATDPSRSARNDDTWCLTDVAGVALAESEWVVDAVSRRTTVEVQLRAGSRVLAAGRTDVRRTVAATVDNALLSAGPLIEMAVARSVPGHEGGDSRPKRVTTARKASRRAAAAFVGRIGRAAVTYRQWGIARLPRHSVDGLVTGTSHNDPLTSLDWQSPPPDHFWADPCVVAHEGREWIFVEQLDRRIGRGHIRALRWEGGTVRPGPVVFATSHHLSYPQVQLVAGRWLATVETCAAANPILTFDRLGDPWRIATDLPALPPHMADPVVEFDTQGRPSHLISTDAVTSPDTHYVEHHFESGGWRRIPAATYVDVTAARGGGSRLGGLRAVQDCAALYGRALHLVPEQDWHGTVYGDPITTVSGAAVTGDWQPAGVHTLTWTPDQEHVWIDGWRRRGSAAGGYRRIIERRHLKECDGT